MIDRLVTFSEFDVFAYLMVGLVLLAVCDLVFETRLILRTNWGFGAGFVIVVTAYVLGHLVSVPGLWFVQEGISKRWSDLPEKVLLSDGKCRDKLGTPIKEVQAPTWLEATIYAHRQPLDCKLLAKIRDKAGIKDAEKLQTHAETIYADAELVARADPYTRDRLLIFQRLYVFSRNMACVAFFGALMILIAPLLRCSWSLISKRSFGRILKKIWLLGATTQTKTHVANDEPMPGFLTNRISLFAIFLIIGLGLLYRHNMFLRIYYTETLVAYANSDIVAPKPAGTK